MAITRVSRRNLPGDPLRQTKTETVASLRLLLYIRLNAAVPPPHRGRHTMTALGMDGLPIGECTRNPDLWTTTADEQAKAICRACPRRWACAREACELPRAEGIWAGI